MESMGKSDSIITAGGSASRNEKKGYSLVQLVFYVVGFLFVYSGIVKLFDVYVFLSDIYGYAIASPRLGVLLAFFLPHAEILMGLCLIANIIRPGSLLLSILLLAVFCLAQGTVLALGRQVSCGCFGSSTETVNLLTLMRTGLILVVCCLLYYIEMRSHSIVEGEAIQGSAS
jgi:putative oxidoreductase